MAFALMAKALLDALRARTQARGVVFGGGAPFLDRFMRAQAAVPSPDLAARPLRQEPLQPPVAQFADVMRASQHRQEGWQVRVGIGQKEQPPTATGSDERNRKATRE